MTMISLSWLPLSIGVGARCDAYQVANKVTVDIHLESSSTYPER
jgi:hypothetical protein